MGIETQLLLVVSSAGFGWLLPEFLNLIGGGKAHCPVTVNVLSVISSVALAGVYATM